jgi:hypothetical protein
MKYFCFIIIVISLISFEKEYYWEYKIKNETSHSIKILGFDRFSYLGIRNEIIEAEIITIQPELSFSIVKSRGLYAQPLGIFQNWEVDSVNIVFDNRKVIVQFCNEYDILELCPVKRNITAYDTEYKKENTGKRSGENEYRFTYTITEEDYNNAVEIDK